jgi:hypothetical protein
MVIATCARVRRGLGSIFMYTVRHVAIGLATGLSVLLAAGCDSPSRSSSMQAGPGRGSGDWASRWIPNVTLAAVRPIAAEVFRSEYRLDLDRSSSDLLVSRPTEAVDGARGERVRDVLGRPNRYRQVATLKITKEGTSVMAQCQVRTERLDTAEQAAFARERGDDRPSDTPIDRVGADAPKAREEWVYVRRDRSAETRILDAISRRFAATQPAVP